MKNYKLLLTMLLVSVVFASCVKDDNDVVKKDDNTVINNSFVYDGKTYEVAEGEIGQYYDDEDFTFRNANFEISLYPKGYFWQKHDIVDDGVYTSISMLLTSSSILELTEGTYTYNIERKSNTVGFCLIVQKSASGSTIFNYTKENTNIDATVTVSKINEIYEILYSITFEDGKKLEGYYKGSLLKHYLYTSG